MTTTFDKWDTHMIRLSFVKRNIPFGILSTHFMSALKLMQKRKVFPVQAMKAHMGWRDSAPPIFILGSRCWWVVNLTPWPLYPGAHWTGGWISPRASLDTSLPGFDPEPSGLQQVTISTILPQPLQNCQVTTRIPIGQMQHVACQFDMSVVQAAIAGLFTQVVMIVIYAVI